MDLHARHPVLCMIHASASPGATSTVKLLYVFRNEDKRMYVIRQTLVSVHVPHPSTFFLFFNHQFIGQVASVAPKETDVLTFIWGLRHVLYDSTAPIHQTRLQQDNWHSFYYITQTAVD